MTEYIIGVCNTEADGVCLYRFTGTEEQMKEKMLEMVKQDRCTDSEAWTHGTEAVEDIEERGLHELYAYGSYENYHIDYSAIETPHIERIK